jgi:iron complex outermembrane recepter protein
MQTSYKLRALAAITAIAPCAIPAAQAATLEEIVVTATRRSESIQTVPISITALSSSRLEEARLEGVRDLAMITPGLNMNNRSNVFIPYIRGIGAQDTSGGQEASVSIYIDGVYQVSPHAGAMNFNNIERVEVLKGPQGTLFGRNATGGLIHVITKEPTQETEIFGKVGYGEFDTVTGQLYAGGGITDNLAADIAINYKDQGEGWGHNLYDGRETPVDHDEGIRSKWVYSGEDTKITFAADWQKNETGAGDMRGFLPGAVAVDGSTHQGGFYDINHNWPGTSSANWGDISSLPNATSSEVAESYVDNWGTMLTLEHDFDFGTFKSITSYREIEQFNTFDNDGTTGSYVEAQQDTNESETFTQEFQLLSDGDGRLNWIVGAFFMDDTSGYTGDNGLTIFGDQVLPIPGAYVSFFSQIETESLAGFAEISYELTESTSLTVGARLTQDTKTLIGEQHVFTVFPGVLGPGAPALNVIPYSAILPDNDKTWTEPTWKVSLEHHLNEDVMAYASYNRGFRSGSYNTVGVTGIPVDPELVDAYEIGLKGNFMDGRVRFNGAVFFYDFQDLQVVISRGASTDLLNAGKAEIYGFDGDLEAAITDNFSIRTGLSILDTEYTEFEVGNLCSHRGLDGRTYTGASIATAGQECDITGNELTRSPDMTYNIGFLYTQETDIGLISASMDYRWTDDFFWEIDNRLTEDAYGLLNGALSWKTIDETWGLTLWGKNLTDEKYTNFQVAQAGGAPSGVGDHYSPGAPRTWGVDVNFRF